jgi:hypothetical protein
VPAEAGAVVGVELRRRRLQERSAVGAGPEVGIKCLIGRCGAVEQVATGRLSFLSAKLRWKHRSSERFPCIHRARIYNSGRPWARNWEERFEQGRERPEN